MAGVGEVGHGPSTRGNLANAGILNCTFLKHLRGFYTQGIVSWSGLEPWIWRHLYATCTKTMVMVAAIMVN